MSEIRTRPKWSPPVLDEKNPIPNLFMYNSLTDKKEKFVPINGKSINWYGCGPTVYDFSHMGHARTYISFDIIRRILSFYLKFDVTYIMNITDIDDKIIKRARQNHLFDNYKMELIKTKDSAKLLDDLKKAQEGLHNVVSKETDSSKKMMYENQIKKIAPYLCPQSSLTQENILACLSDSQDSLSAYLDKIHGAGVTDKKIYFALADKFEKFFHEDMKALNIIPPDKLIRVREVIPEIIQFCEKLIQNGFGYEQNGSVYFDTIKFNQHPNHFYAKLVPSAFGDKGLLDEGEGDLFTSNSFVDDKKSTSDFVLWKSSKIGEPSWESPWGPGRPGWHIECSVMASKFFGNRMDLHSGGVDLKFPHHDNELAQSEAYHNCENWVNYFLHSGHLTIEGCKMSKSLKNFITIREALEQYSARRIRILLLLHSWRETLDYSTETLRMSAFLDRILIDFFYNLNYFIELPILKFETKTFVNPESDLLQEYFEKCQNDVHDFLCDSFNTREAVLLLRELIGRTKIHLTLPTDKSLHSVIMSIGHYIMWIFQILGCDSKHTSNIPSSYLELDNVPPFGLDLAMCSEKNPKYNLHRLTDVLKLFLKEKLETHIKHINGEIDISLKSILDQLENLINELDAVETEKSEFLFEMQRWKPWLKKVGLIREAVRLICLRADFRAKNSDLSKNFLVACDWLRDVGLANIGVKLEDRMNSFSHGTFQLQLPPAIGLFDEHILMEESSEIEKSKLEKETAKQKTKEKQINQFSLSAKDWFQSQTHIYSQFDENGLPTHDSKGVQLSKNSQSKLKKQFEKHNISHLDFLSKNKI